MLEFEDNLYSMILDTLQKSPESIQFSDVIAHIDEHYAFAPTTFKNGETVNNAGENNGSCKIFSFAKMNNLSTDETLALFGDFYRKDVLENPKGEDHQNIRNFQKYGWDGISFEGEALSKKS